MSRPERIEIEILNWDKYNPRKDLKSTSWLRLENDLFGSPKFISFSHAEICLWIYILSQGSKEQTGKITLFLEHAKIVGKFSLEVVQSGLRKLNEIDVIKCSRNAYVTHATRERDVDDTLRTNERDERNVTNETNGLQARSEDLGPATPGSVSSFADYATELQKDPKFAEAEMTLFPVLPLKPKAKPKPKKDSPPSSVARVREAFLNSYKSTFGKEYPGWGAPEYGKATQWLKSIPLEKALEYCALYPHWNDPWVTKCGHTFGILVSKYVQLDAWVSRAPQILEKMALGRATERAHLTKLERSAEIKAHDAIRGKSDPRHLVAGGGTVQIGSERGIFEQPEVGNPFETVEPGESEASYAEGL